MIPIRDKTRSGIVPWVIYGLIAINLAAFLYELSLPRDDLNKFALTYGLVPARVTSALQTKTHWWEAMILPAFTSMFLHGGWLHLIGNMWFLHIFGDNVEGRLGHVMFLVFYILCGLAAGAAQYLLNPASPIPTIGASGAIAGVLGGYIICWPNARIVTLLPLFFIVTFVELPAVLVIGFWILIQFLSGAATIGAEFLHGGVAYWAHVGGFLAGMLLILMLPGPGRGKARAARWII